MYFSWDSDESLTVVSIRSYITAESPPLFWSQERGYYPSQIRYLSWSQNTYGGSLKIRNGFTTGNETYLGGFDDRSPRPRDTLCKVTLNKEQERNGPRRTGWITHLLLRPSLYEILRPLPWWQFALRRGILRQNWKWHLVCPISNSTKLWIQIVQQHRLLVRRHSKCMGCRHILCKGQALQLCCFVSPIGLWSPFQWTSFDYACQCRRGVKATKWGHLHRPLTVQHHWGFWLELTGQQ